jgi:hypothetical protein
MNCNVSKTNKDFLKIKCGNFLKCPRKSNGEHNRAYGVKLRAAKQGPKKSSVICNVFADKTERNCPLLAAGTNCMTHREVLQASPDTSPVSRHKDSKINLAIFYLHLYLKPIPRYLRPNFFPPLSGRTTFHTRFL